jgi:hypothetical protein
MLVRFGPNARRDSDNLQMNSLCADGLRRDAGREQMSLHADNFLPSANETAGRLWLVSFHVGSAITHGCFSYPGLVHRYGEIAVQLSVQCSLISSPSRCLRVVIGGGAARWYEAALLLGAVKRDASATRAKLASVFRRISLSSDVASSLDVMTRRTSYYAP